jgi:hypothetical protein
MITHSLFDGPNPKSGCSQQQRVEDSLAEVVHFLSVTNQYYGSWIEEVRLDGGKSVVRIGFNGMSGERWIHVYEGSAFALVPLVQVCYWFYKTGGDASDEFKANPPEGFALKQESPMILSPSAGYKPWHGGRLELAAA